MQALLDGPQGFRIGIVQKPTIAPKSITSVHKTHVFALRMKYVNRDLEQVFYAANILTALSGTTTKWYEDDEDV